MVLSYYLHDIGVFIPLVDENTVNNHKSDTCRSIS